MTARNVLHDAICICVPGLISNTYARELHAPASTALERQHLCGFRSHWSQQLGPRTWMHTVEQKTAVVTAWDCGSLLAAAVAEYGIRRPPRKMAKRALLCGCNYPGMRCACVLVVIRGCCARDQSAARHARCKPSFNGIPVTRTVLWLLCAQARRQRE
jgi:hypothetical protein